MEQSQPVVSSIASVTEQLDVARKILDTARNVLVITGAGISAESGVPTFRGAGGYWRNRHYSELAKSDAFANAPELVWQWYCERRKTVSACEPNVAHRALAEWAKRRDGVTLVTQNVDGLHERAGHPDVIRLHGSLWKNRCTACGTERDETTLEYPTGPLEFFSHFVSPCCGKLERPAVVWFGESVSEEIHSSCIPAVAEANVILVIGTSGVVNPAARFIQVAGALGAIVIEVNPDVSSVRSNIWLQCPATQVVPALLAS